MSKRCPDCHAINEDSRVFCSSCGSPLDAELRLIQDLEKQKHITKPDTAPPSKRDDDDDYVPPTVRKEQKSVVPWIVLGLVVIIAAAAWFLLK